jgi:hypothetical protein
LACNACTVQLASLDMYETNVFHIIPNYPSPSSPRMDIDVYLQLLIEEIQDLLNVEVCTFDVLKKKKKNCATSTVDVDN